MSLSKAQNNALLMLYRRPGHSGFVHMTTALGLDSRGLVHVSNASTTGFIPKSRTEGGAWPHYQCELLSWEFMLAKRCVRRMLH